MNEANAPRGALLFIVKWYKFCDFIIYAINRLQRSIYIIAFLGALSLLVSLSSTAS